MASICQNDQYFPCQCTAIVGGCFTVHWWSVQCFEALALPERGWRRRPPSKRVLERKRWDFMGIVLLNMIVYMSISNNHNDFSLGLNQQNSWHMFFKKQHLGLFEKFGKPLVRLMVEKIIFPIIWWPEIGISPVCGRIQVFRRCFRREKRHSRFPSETEVGLSEMAASPFLPWRVLTICGCRWVCQRRLLRLGDSILPGLSVRQATCGAPTWQSNRGCCSTSGGIGGETSGTQRLFVGHLLMNRQRFLRSRSQEFSSV